MKYVMMIIIPFLASCHCDNETMELKGKVFSSIDSLPLSNYNLYLNYSQHVKGELGSCGLNFRDAGLQTNSVGDFLISLKVATKSNNIKIKGQHNELLYDSVIHNQVVIYVNP